MRDPAFLFFAAAVVCASGGMLWGIQMAIRGDHLLASAHAHLNLVGWVTLALTGIYYRMTPTANDTLAAKAHAIAALSGVGVMVPGIAIVIQGGTPVIAAAGAFLSMASMLILVGMVFRHGFGVRPRGSD